MRMTNGRMASHTLLPPHSGSCPSQLRNAACMRSNGVLLKPWSTRNIRPGVLKAGSGCVPPPSASCRMLPLRLDTQPIASTCKHAVHAVRTRGACMQWFVYAHAHRHRLRLVGGHDGHVAECKRVVWQPHARRAAETQTPALLWTDQLCLQPLQPRPILAQRLVAPCIEAMLRLRLLGRQLHLQQLMPEGRAMTRGGGLLSGRRALLLQSRLP